MTSSAKNTDHIDPLDVNPLERHPLAKAIVDTTQDVLVILDGDLKIISANKAFYKKFDLDFDGVQGKIFYDIGNGEWNIPALRKLLEEVIPEHKVVENYEVRHRFLRLGQRAMLINAREILYGNNQKNILISIFDITESKKLRRDNQSLIIQKDTLLRELHHRIANTLQIMASILVLKAQNAISQETRVQLEDAYDRVVSVATIQGHLDPTGLGKNVNVPTYLRDLCQSLTASILEKCKLATQKSISIKVQAESAKVTPDEATALGLITTELVVNAIKHAFSHQESGEVTVIYEARGSDWKLAVKDNGRGSSTDGIFNLKGLGTDIIDSLAKQLNAVVEIQSTADGTIVSIVHR